jgi:hypothetical protein
MDDAPEGRAIGHITLDNPPPCLSLGHRDLGIAVAWEVHEVKGVVDQITVQQTGLAGCGTGSGEVFTAEQGVEKRGLSDVGTAGEGDLGQSVTGELVEPGRAEDEFSSQDLHALL